MSKYARQWVYVIVTCVLGIRPPCWRLAMRDRDQVAAGADPAPFSPSLLLGPTLPPLASHHPCPVPFVRPFILCIQFLLSHK
jgi:hypothetical protein